MKCVKILACVVLMSSLASFAQAAPTVLRLGHGNQIESHTQAGGEVFAKVVAEGTQGRYAVELFPAAALGNERQMLEGAQIGSVDLVLTSNGPLGNFVKESLILDIPYLFRDKQHAEDVLNGPIGQNILDKLPGIGLQGLGWAENGMRHLTNSKHAVKNAGDFKGLKIRTMENPIHIKAFNMLGALATPLPFPELFTALQQGVVDGQENPLVPIAGMKFDQVQPYLSLTGHVYSPLLIVMSGDAWQSLSEDDQKVFMDAARQASAAIRAYNDANEKRIVDDFKARGINVVEDFDKESCIKALAPLYEEMAATYGDLVQQIQSYGK